jgi:hypothetical protein
MIAGWLCMYQKLDNYTRATIPSLLIPMPEEATNLHQRRFCLGGADDAHFLSTVSICIPGGNIDTGSERWAGTIFMLGPLRAFFPCNANMKILNPDPNATMNMNDVAMRFCVTKVCVAPVERFILSKKPATSV